MNRFVAAVVAGVLAATPITATAQDYSRYSDAAAQTELARIAEVQMAGVSTKCGWRRCSAWLA